MSVHITTRTNEVFSSSVMVFDRYEDAARFLHNIAGKRQVVNVAIHEPMPEWTFTGYHPIADKKRLLGTPLIVKRK